MTALPAFLPETAVALRARLGEMPGCWLEVRCSECRNATHIPMKLLAQQRGPDAQIGAIVARLSCKRCRVPPSEVWLNETHNRTHNFGGAPGWSVQLVGGAEAAEANDGSGPAPVPARRR